jgi:uncharacterized protein YbaR (Trm112 family)/SAM-dependent methyltransferase
MRPELLDILECPFCGGALRLDERAPTEWRDGTVVYGALYCSCSAYPVVDGIPFVQAGPMARKAIAHINAGRGERALVMLLGASNIEVDRLAPLLRDDPSVTFRDALELLSRDAEGMYLLYRFSDPTYLASRALLDAVGQDERCFARRVLDVGGGTGHLTRTLCAMADGRTVVLADITFWKTWLARRYVAPECQPVCCDANASLPFADDAFSLAFCSDAFHYVWARRSLATEMTRLAGEHGVVMLAHLHNALVENPSAGMPLDPAGYRRLFRGLPHRMLGERALLQAALGGADVDLASSVSDDALAVESALCLVATRMPGIFRRYRLPAAIGGPGGRSLNPLYQRERDGGTDVLRLRFPSDYYEMEFAACRSYLPETIVLDGADEDALGAFVTLDLPARYA